MGNSPAKIETISRTVSENVQRSLTSTLVNMVSSTDAVLSANQVIDINGVVCKGDINISNIGQKTVIKYNLTRLNNSTSYQNIKSSIANGIQNALNSDTSVKKGALSLATDMGIKNESEAMSRTVNEIVNSYTYNNFTNDVTNINSAQVISIKNLLSQTGNCNIGNVPQTIVLDALANQIATSVAKNTVDLLSKSSLYQETSTKTSYEQTGVLQDLFTGLTNLFSSISGFVWIFIFIVLVAVFGFGYLVYNILSSDSDIPKQEL